MGLEIQCQAIPPSSGLIELAREDKELGELLSLVPDWLRSLHGRSVAHWPQGYRLWNVLCEMVKAHPGIEKRNCDLDRSWDKLHYLLSATRRGEHSFEEDLLLDKAVRGSVAIAEHARAPQGVPVNYVSPSEVELIAIVLEPMNGESLSRHYVPTKMEASEVYKFWSDRADREEWNSILQHFTLFRAFYLEAAGHGDGVIICLD